MSIYSNDNIRKIVKLTTRELPHLVQKRENNCTVRENNGFYSIIIKAFLPLKVAGNYAVKQNSIVHLSAWKMQMSTFLSNIFLSGGIEHGSKGNELL